MDTFETLLFVPEGSLFNEKLALKNALKKTLKHFNHEFGPADQLKYTQLNSQFKFLSEKKQVQLLLANYLGQSAATDIFVQELLSQNRLVKNTADFLEKVKGKVKLLCFSRFNQNIALPRLKSAGIDRNFDALFFADMFTEKLPDKKIFDQILQNTNTDPDSTLVIGTNLTEEIQAAENANLKSLWLAPKKEKIPITPHPTLHLSRLSDLLFYLNIE